MTFSPPESRGGAITPPPPEHRYSPTYHEYEVSPIASETRLPANGNNGHQGGRSLESGSSGGVGDHRRHSSFSHTDRGRNEFVGQSYQVPREATHESHSTAHQKKTAPSVRLAIYTTLSMSIAADLHSASLHSITSWISSNADPSLSNPTTHYSVHSTLISMDLVGKPSETRKHTDRTI